MEYYVDYYWQDGLLTQQMLHYYLEVTIQGVTRTEEVLISSKFVYDENNQPVGCVANGEAAYAFVRNLQGDIIAVVDQDGETLVEYSYDPWGKVTSTHNGENLTELEASLVMVMCPFAYRGYNYDFSTGLYYLQSRYYNPEWGRFLNCDDTNILLATKGETLGANLFAYCNNNPINFIDCKGTQAKYNLKLVESEVNLVAIILCAIYYKAFTVGVDRLLTPDEDYYNSKKGAIVINMQEKIPQINGDFSDILFAAYDYYLNEYSKNIAEKIFDALAQFSTHLFYEDFAAKFNAYYKGEYQTSKREFLFSDDCVSNEIKHHCLAYWWACGKMKLFDSSVLLVVGGLFNADGVKKSCSLIEIYEQDAEKIRDRTAFGYFSGIRDNYKYTSVDPYWRRGIIRIYQNVREEWKSQPIIC